jgi:hypothetical protein
MTKTAEDGGGADPIAQGSREINKIQNYFRRESERVNTIIEKAGRQLRRQNWSTNLGGYREMGK